MRQGVIVGVVVPSTSIISPVDYPAPLSNTVRARKTIFCCPSRPRTMILLLVLITTVHITNENKKDCS